MVKFFSTEHLFRHPWSHVTAAWWRKYPNPSADHVKEIDCFDRKLDQQGRLITNRIITCESKLPRWMEKVGIPNLVYATETTVVDPDSKEMVIKSRNITGSSIIVIEETCTYSVHEENKSWTNYRQEAKIHSFLPVVSSRCEHFSYTNIMRSSGQGLRRIENLCETIQSEGLTSLVDQLSSLRDRMVVGIESVIPSTTPITAAASAVNL